MREILFITFLLLPGTNLFGQYSFNSVEEVWNYALGNNPQNSVYNLKIESTENTSRAARSYIYPKVSGGFSFQKNSDIPETPVPGEIYGKPGQTSYLKFGQKYNYSASVTVSKTILDWRSRFQYRIASLTIELSKAEKEYFEQTLKEQIAQLYYSALTAKEALRIGQSDLSVSNEMLANSESRFAEGVIDSLAYNQALINRNNAFEKLEMNRQYQLESMNNLKQLMGLNRNDTIILKEDISVETINRNPESFFTINKYTELLRLQNDISGVEVSKARSMFYPKIDIVHYFGVQQYQEEFKLKPSDWKSNQYTGISVSIPIFTGFLNKAQYDAAVIENKIAEINYKDEIRKSAIDDENLTSAYTSTMIISQKSKETFQISKKNIQLALQKYSQGIYALDDYLKIFDDYLTVETQYLNNLSEFLVNKAIIEVRQK